MTKDIQRAILRACARFIGKSLDPILKRLDVIEKSACDRITKGDADALREAWDARFAEVKAIPGPQGPAGKDAESIIMTDVIDELVRCAEIQPILSLLVTEAVAKHMAENPIPAGRDGKDGEQGPQGVSGEKGADGKHGADVTDALIDRDGALVLTLSDGRTKSLGVVVGKDGAAGANGRDGLSMADVTREYDAAAHEVVERWTVAGEAKELRYPAGGIRPGGFWAEGMKCHALQAITHDGALWIAKRDTATKPCIEKRDDWQLAARKGRDGRDGKDGKPPPAPVKLLKSEGSGNGA